MDTENLIEEQIMNGLDVTDDPDVLRFYAKEYRLCMMSALKNSCGLMKLASNLSSHVEILEQEILQLNDYIEKILNDGYNDDNGDDGTSEMMGQY